MSTSSCRASRVRRVPVRLSLSALSALSALGVAVASLGAACVPPGNSTPSDAGPTTTQAAPTSTIKPSENVMKAPFLDTFDRPATSAPTAVPAPSASAGPSATSSASAAIPLAPGGPELGSDWQQAGTNVWHIENGKLCGQGARNHGVWMTRVLPINARIEFDAVSDSHEGDLKAEFWGDGRSAATSLSYTNATSYLTLFGGWKNKTHALARINEHGKDRKEISVDPTSDDPRQKPVMPGQIYRFKVERTDGKTIHWYVDDIEFLSLADPQPLAGAGHDHFGFNDWDAKVCFDNVRVTPLP